MPYRASCSTTYDVACDIRSLPSGHMNSNIRPRARNSSPGRLPDVTPREDVSHSKFRRSWCDISMRHIVQPNSAETHRKVSQKPQKSGEDDP